MSLIFPAAYSAKLHSSTIDIDWLFHFENDNAGLVYLACKDRSVDSNRYYGIIEDPGEITRELDLINCTASIGEISISCIDKYKTGKLTAELLHNGTDHYINQKVLIYECANNETTLSNCPLLYEGRLKEIDIQGNGCVLMIEQWTPFDHIMIPNVISDENGIYSPVVYGDFAENAANAFPTEVNLRPCVRHLITQNTAYYAVESNAPSGRLHFYDETLQSFLPGTATPTTSTKNGVPSKPLSSGTQRDFYFRPDEVNTTDTTMVAGAGSLENIYDADTSSGFDQTLTDNETALLVLNVPLVRGTIKFIDVHVKGYIDISSTSGTSTATVDVSVDGGNTWTQIEQRTTAGADADQYRLTGDIVGDFNADEPYFIGSEFTLGDNCPDIRIRITTASDVPDISADFYFTDVFMDVHIGPKNDDRTDVLESMDVAYTGVDGYDADYTDGGGAVASEVHVIHRDIMNRFGGVDYGDAYMNEWTNVNIARDGWDARVWILEPMALKSVLEKLQFEGCFIFTLTADSDGSQNPGGKYIWVENTYANADFPDTDGDPVVQVFDENDYINFSIGHTDMFEVITKTTYNFDRHPATEAYRSTTEYDNTTERDNWNLSTQHFEQIDLDFLVGSKNGTDEIYDSGAGDNTASESIALYRDNIQGEPKILIDFEVVNKKKTNVEYGDIIQCNDSNVDPYGESWTNLYFMVISERRSKTGLSITAREVYRA